MEKANFSDKIMLELDDQVKLMISDKQAVSIITSITKPTYSGNLGFLASFDKLVIYNKVEFGGDIIR